MEIGKNKNVIVEESSEHIIKRMKEKLDSTKDSVLYKYEFFNVKMKYFSKNKRELEKKQEILDEQLSALNPFRVKNEIKKNKALQKIKDISKYIEKQRLVFNNLLQKIIKLKRRKDLLLNSIDKLNRHKEFIEDALLLLPKDYVKMQKDQSIEGLIIRFKSLFGLNAILLSTLETFGLKLKELSNEERGLLNSKQVLIMGKCSQIKELINTNNEIYDVLQGQQRYYYDIRNSVRSKVKNFGIILLSIDNITNKCFYIYKSPNIWDVLATKSPSLKTTHILDKLKIIEDFVTLNIDILRIISHSNPFNSMLKDIMNRKYKK